MNTIIYWRQGPVINVMTAKEANFRDRQSQLIEKYWRKGMSKEIATNKARVEIPDATVISFTTDHTAPLRSRTGTYGHAGYDDLYNQLVAAGSLKVVNRVMRLRNLEDWNLPAPTVD